MGYRIPDTVYDSGLTYAWANANDRVAYQRAFDAGNGEEKRKAQAMLVANPQTSNLEIQRNMNNPNIPSRFGYEDSKAMKIEQILGNEMEQNTMNMHAWNDFSGKDSSYSGTDLPSMPIW